jgi:hypothetical protein
MPFRISLPGQMLRIHSTSFQFSVVSNCVAIHVPSAVMSSVPLRWPTRLPKVRRLPRSTPATQAGLVAKSKNFDTRPFRRHRHAVLDVGMALPDHLQVDRQHQRAALGRDGALDQP